MDTPVEQDSSDTFNTHGDHLLKPKELYGIFSVVEVLHIDHAEISASRWAEMRTYTVLQGWKPGATMIVTRKVEKNKSTNSCGFNKIGS